MYFDIDHRISLGASHSDHLIDSISQEVRRRRGNVVESTGSVIVFTAPFWRVNGIFYFIVKQMPVGVSHGVISVVQKDDTVITRVRVSLLWLRLCIVAVVGLLGVSVVMPETGNKVLLGTILVVACGAGALVYFVAIIETRRFFERIIQGSLGGKSTERSVTAP